MLKIVNSTSSPIADENGYPVVRYNYSLDAQVVLSNNRIAGFLLALLFGASVVVAFITKSTYDTGDSISHYLLAHFAPQHPENLLNAWAKPVFTLLATLPAQGGFLGMKLFQCVVVAASAWLAYRIAQGFRLAWPALAIVFCYAAPDYFRIQFSGLTEPLFGLILVGSVALAVADRPNWSTALISWLPFVRSEGTLLWGLWVLYLLWNRNWRALPLLMIGYAVYSLIGGLVLGDYAWLFTDNPYSLHSQYGSGNWNQFVYHFPTLLGWPLTFLFVMGGLYMLRRTVVLAEWSRRLFRAELLLVYGSIVVFVAAHSAFWALGLFGSFGMTRVLTVLTPLAAVVSLSGLTWLSQAPVLRRGRRYVLATATVVVACMVFSRDHGFTTETGAFIGHESNLHWRRDFQQSKELVLGDVAMNWLRNYDPHWRWHPIAFEHPYYPAALDLDQFEPGVRPPLTHDWRPNLDMVPVSTYVLWDSWFCPVEGRLPLALLEKDKRYKQLWSGYVLFNPSKPEEGRHQCVIFEKMRP